MSGSDILLVPSVTASNGDEEGIPVVIMEAFAHGLPVIGTRHSGIPEIIRDGVNGSVVPERDVPGLSEKIDRFIQDPVTARKMSRAGREEVETNYDIRKQNRRLLEIFSSIT